MKNLKSIAFGLLLILAGVLLALKYLDVISFNVLADGWWTLLLIIPHAIGLFTERDKAGNAIVLAIFTFIFLSGRDIIDSDMIWKLIFTAVIVIIGVNIVVSAVKKPKKASTDGNAKKNEKLKSSVAVFSGSDLKLGGEKFDGATLTAVFGGIEYDLRGAVIEDDCEIRLSAVFGGIDIILPEGVNVKSDVTGLFGGTSDKTEKCEGAPTIYVSGVCIFGGAEIKN